MNADATNLSHATARRRRALRRVVGILIAAFVAAPLAAIEVGAPVAVTLFPTGVAEVVHRVEVTGSEELELVVDLAHMADVVRTLTVIDPAGSADIASFAGGESAAERLGRFRFDLSNVSSLTSLVAQARGASVEIARERRAADSGEVIGSSRMAGTLIGGDGSSLLLATASGVVTVPDDEIASLAFADPTLEAAFAEALAALGQIATEDRSRTLSIVTADGARRTVEIRYLRPNPMWRVSYRAVVEPSTGEVRLQGWAHVDNVGAIDWDHLSLTLVSAEPVTLGVDLYTPRYPSRTSPSVASRPFAAAPAAPSMARSSMADAEMAFEPSIATGSQFVGQEVADGFAFTLPVPVTLAAGRSALVPLVDQPVEARRVRAWDPRRDGTRARASLELTNSTDVQLPPGPVTIYEAGRYVGDGELPLLVPEGDATLTFARDLDLEIEVRGEPETTELLSIRVVDGLLVTERRARRTVTYQIDWGRSDPGDGAPLLLTHHVTGGWSVVSPSSSVGEVGSITLAATRPTLTVVEEQVREQRVGLVNVAVDELVLYSSNRLLDPATRRIVANVAELRRELSDRERARAMLENEERRIIADQSRVRANMAALAQDSSLYRRYERDLSQSEDQLERIERELTDARAQEASARDALTAYLRTLSD